MSFDTESHFVLSALSAKQDEVQNCRSKFKINIVKSDVG